MSYRCWSSSLFCPPQGFYPTALAGCLGIVFTHGVQMGEQAAEKICPGGFSETVRCRKLILGRDIGWGVGVVWPWFDLAIVTSSVKIFSGLYLNHVGSWCLVGTLVWRCGCATLWCDLDLTLLKWTLHFKYCLGYILASVQCRKFLLSRDIAWGYRCASS